MPKSRDRVMTLAVSLWRLGMVGAQQQQQHGDMVHASLHYGDDRHAPMEGGVLHVPHAGTMHLFRYRGAGNSRHGTMPSSQPGYLCNRCGSMQHILTDPSVTTCALCGTHAAWSLPIEFLFEPM